MKFLVIDFTKMESLTRKLYSKISKDYRPDIIIGIARGGWIPARLLSDIFERENPECVLASMKIEFYQSIGNRRDRPIVTQDVSWSIRGKKVLIIDDLADTGTSLQTAAEYLTYRGPEDIKIATLYYKPWSKLRPDYFIETTDAWVVFPHEYYEFMNERASMEEKSKEDLQNEFLELKIPEATVKYFFEKFYISSSFEQESSSED